MARRGIPKEPVNWYLREWMAQAGMKQADMMRATDWSKATMSQLYNGQQGYSPKIIKEAAAALHIAEYELLLHPSDANALRRMRKDALRIVQGGLSEAAPVDPPATEKPDSLDPTGTE